MTKLTNDLLYLTQVAMILFDNAAKYTNKEGNINIALNEHHGGKISVKSVLNEKTTFTVKFS